MSSNEERREAARRKLEERLASERRAERQRRLAIISVCSVAVLAAVAVGGYFLVRHLDDERHTTCEYTYAQDDWVQILKTVEQQVSSAPAAERAKADKYLAFVREGAKKAGTSPIPDSRTLKSGTVDWTLNTNLGALPITLDRSSAPCNVNAVIALSQNKYYDGTDCYGLTKTDDVNLLQCGDPTRTGAAGPGWTSPDENPSDLKPAATGETAATDTRVIYPRGTVAISNRNDDQQQVFGTGNARFMIVTKDSKLPASFAIIGTVSEEGMKVVDKVVAGGIDPGPVGNDKNGFPKTALEIKSTSVSE